MLLCWGCRKVAISWYTSARAAVPPLPPHGRQHPLPLSFSFSLCNIVWGEATIVRLPVLELCSLWFQVRFVGVRPAWGSFLYNNRWQSKKKIAKHYTGGAVREFVWEWVKQSNWTIPKSHNGGVRPGNVGLLFRREPCSRGSFPRRCGREASLRL